MENRAVGFAQFAFVFQDFRIMCGLRIHHQVAPVVQYYKIQSSVAVPVGDAGPVAPWGHERLTPVIEIAYILRQYRFLSRSGILYPPDFAQAVGNNDVQVAVAVHIPRNA